VTCASRGYINEDKFLQLSRIHNIMISHKKYNVYSLLTIVVSVLQKNPLNHCAEFLTDRHSLLEVQQLPQSQTFASLTCTLFHTTSFRNMRD